MEVQKGKLFVVNPRKPMKFCIFQGQMLAIKCNQVAKKIKEHGGIVVNYIDKDQECIILAHKSSIPRNADNVFSIKYVRDCISKDEILNLPAYRISKSGKQPSSTKNCVDLKKFLRSEKCKHRMSGEEVVEKINEFAKNSH